MQVKKKAAKKTYKSSAKKKTVPELKMVTMDELKAIIAETFKAMAEAHAKTEAANAKTLAANAKIVAANAKTMAANAKTVAANAKTEAAAFKAAIEASFKASFEKWEAAHAKTEASIDMLSAENRLLSAEVKETSEAVRQLHDTLGGMGGHLGEVIEFIVIPKIRPAINALGDHSFKEITANKIVETVIYDRKRKLTEVDVLLYGDTEAMAVEIKTCLQTTDVDKHLDRLQKLRDHEVDAEVNGRTLFGAVVGAIVHDPVRTYALKKGLYVIEIREEEDKLDIDKPDTCRTW